VCQGYRLFVASPKSALPKEDAEPTGSRQNGSGNRTRATSIDDATVETVRDDFDKPIWTPADADADQASRVCKGDDEAEQYMSVSFQSATTRVDRFRRVGRRTCASQLS